MTEPPRQEQPEEIRDPEKLLTSFFSFSDEEAERLQAKRGWTIDELQHWIHFKRLAFRSSTIKSVAGFVQYHMRNCEHPGQAKQSWWHPKGHKPPEDPHLPSYDQPYKPPEPAENIMSWQEFQKQSGRIFKGKKGDKGAYEAPF